MQVNFVFGIALFVGIYCIVLNECTCFSKYTPGLSDTSHPSFDGIYPQSKWKWVENDWKNISVVGVGLLIPLGCLLTHRECLFSTIQYLIQIAPLVFEKSRIRHCCHHCHSEWGDLFSTTKWRWVLAGLDRPLVVCKFQTEISTNSKQSSVGQSQPFHIAAFLMKTENFSPWLILGTTWIICRAWLSVKVKNES